MKTFRPLTPSLRQTVLPDFAEITKADPEKALIEKHGKTGGRNAYGRITSRFRGGGHKRRYRVIDFKRDKREVPAKVAAIEYDPNRTCRLALLHYADGEKRYILAPDGLKVGDTVVAGPESDVKPGNALPLRTMPVGTTVHNVEMKPGKGGQLIRSAGTFAQFLAREGSYATLRLPSGEIRKVHVECYATVGQVGNLQHENVSLGKAGRKRWLGKKPHNRATCMNPVDHPMGGGEGRGKGNHPMSPWGQLAKGYKTRRVKSTGKFIVKRRGKK